MSRTGTSLLYQLLYGHEELLFFPPRIQLACSSPIGFPYTLKDEISDEDFINTLIEKTTIAINTNESTRWHNIDIRPIREALGEQSMQSIFTRFKQHYLIRADTRSIPMAIYTYINAICSELSFESDYNDPRKKGLILHDDHLYVLGTSGIKDHDASACFIQTVRHPLDLVASRKNMLVFHLGENKHPSKYELKEEVLEAETIRAVWGLIASVLNRAISGDHYTVVAFEHLRTEAREKTMRLVGKRLDLKWTNTLLEETTGSNEKWCNELLFAGSTLHYLTNGKEQVRVGAAKAVLTEKEQKYVKNMISPAGIDDLFRTDPCLFENAIECAVVSLIGLHKTLGKWRDDYHTEKYLDIWNEYSALNYGKSRAAESFINQ